jgi:hypothetical protein
MVMVQVHVHAGNGQVVLIVLGNLQPANLLLP